MSVFFSRFMENESQCGTNKSREPRSGSRAICLFRTAIHWQCLQQRSLLKFSEQSKKFKFPAEIGHLILFPDKTILAYSFRQNSAGSCRRFCRLFIDILIKTKAWLIYHCIYIDIDSFILLYDVVNKSNPWTAEDANYKNRTLTLALLRNWVSSASF